MLGPVVALALWTHAMWFWMYATRLPAISAAKMKLDPDAARGAQMATLPPRVRWKADNYNHLLEEPTLFYAMAVVLTVVGVSAGWPLYVAWAYVVVRIIHSIWQAQINDITTRFLIFSSSSLLLMALSVRAAMAVFAP